MSSEADTGRKLTIEGNRLVDNWKLAERRVKSAEAELSSARTNLINCRNTLGKWLLAPDVIKPVPGEKICVWFGDSLIQVTAPEMNKDPEVTLRFRGKEWDK